MSAFYREQVKSVQHWTDDLFSFTTTRTPGFRFQNGQFAMMGLEVDGRPLLRAYSMASANHEENLEFFSIKVPDGPLTSRLQKIKAGDNIFLGKKSTGTLVLDALKPGKRLFLMGTGTGLAPWLSVARDPEAYERFEQVIVTHTVRKVNDLAYFDLFDHELAQDELFGELCEGKLAYYPTVTRDEFKTKGRITTLIQTGQIRRDLGVPGDKFDPAEDRVMLCGSMAMIKDTAAILESHGMVEGSNAEPGDFVLERAFVG